MQKTKFGVFKSTTFLGVMALYFFMAYSAMRRFGFLQGFAPDVRKRAWAVIAILYCAVFFVCLQYFEGMRIGRRRLLDLFFGFFAAACCVNGISAALCAVLTPVRWPALLGAWVLLVVLQSAAGVAWVIACHRQYEKLQFRKEAVFVYGGREDRGEYERVNNTINRYFRVSRSVSFTEGLGRVLDVVREAGVVYLGDIPVDIRNVVLKFCMSERIECYSIPKISDIYIQNSRVMQLNDKLLLRYPQLEIAGEHAAAKRAMDVAGALLMLACASPAMLAIAILVKLEDGGPAIYRQDRVTLNGRPFRMLKFRSMRVDAERDGMRMAQKDDARVTRVGRVIRNLHFDELPQLVNVLRGEMSLVGPRPERREFIEAYARRIPEFPERLKVRAGLTGYAQVYGRYNTEPEDKIKYDLYYIYNYSFWLDLKLLVLTVRILFQKENTEGVDAGQVNAMRVTEDETGDVVEDAEHYPVWAEKR